MLLSFLSFVWAANWFWYIQHNLLCWMERGDIRFFCLQKDALTMSTWRLSSVRLCESSLFVFMNELYAFAVNMEKYTSIALLVKRRRKDIRFSMTSLKYPSHLGAVYSRAPVAPYAGHRPRVWSEWKKAPCVKHFGARMSCEKHYTDKIPLSFRFIIDSLLIKGNLSSFWHGRRHTSCRLSDWNEE